MKAVLLLLAFWGLAAVDAADTTDKDVRETGKVSPMDRIGYGGAVTSVLSSQGQDKDNTRRLHQVANSNPMTGSSSDMVPAVPPSPAGPSGDDGSVTVIDGFDYYMNSNSRRRLLWGGWGGSWGGRRGGRGGSRGGDGGGSAAASSSAAAAGNSAAAAAAAAAASSRGRHLLDWGWGRRDSYRGREGNGGLVAWYGGRKDGGYNGGGGSAAASSSAAAAGDSAAAAAAAAAASGRGRHLLDWGWGHHGHNDKGRHHTDHHGWGGWYGGWRNGHGRDHDGNHHGRHLLLDWGWGNCKSHGADHNVRPLCNVCFGNWFSSSGDSSAAASSAAASGGCGK